MPTLIVGLLSDTHIPHRLRVLPEAVLDALAGVDLILHAGDVDSPESLDPLRAIAPVYAVRGNVHVLDLSDGGAALPAVVDLHLAGRRVVLTHGHQPGLFGFLLKGLYMIGLWIHMTSRERLNRRTAHRLTRLYPGADVIVFGHSHRAHVERVGDTLLINPGAVCVTSADPPSVARLRLGAGPPEVEIVPLSAYRRPGPTG